MFVNIGKLKKLMTQAYKKGLRVAKNPDSLYMNGGYWEIEIMDAFVPKQIKGCLIELTGEIPEVGEMFEATKEGNQTETGFHTKVRASASTQEIRITSFVIHTPSSNLQLIQTDEGRIHTVNPYYVGMVDNSCIDEENGEYAVQEGMLDGQDSIFWENNVMSFRAMLNTDSKYSQILKQMETINLTDLYFGEDEG